MRQTLKCQTQPSQCQREHTLQLPVLHRFGPLCTLVVVVVGRQSNNQKTSIIYNAPGAVYVVPSFVVHFIFNRFLSLSLPLFLMIYTWVFRVFSVAASTTCAPQFISIVHRSSVDGLLLFHCRRLRPHLWVTRGEFCVVHSTFRSSQHSKLKCAQFTHLRWTLRSNRRFVDADDRMNRRNSDWICRTRWRRWTMLHWNRKCANSTKAARVRVRSKARSCISRIVKMNSNNRISILLIRINRNEYSLHSYGRTKSLREFHLLRNWMPGEMEIWFGTIKMLFMVADNTHGWCASSMMIGSMFVGQIKTN